MKEQLDRLWGTTLAGYASSHSHASFFPAIVGVALVLPIAHGALKPSDSPVTVRAEDPVTLSAPVPVAVMQPPVSVQLPGLNKI